MKTVAIATPATAATANIAVMPRRAGVDNGPPPPLFAAALLELPDDTPFAPEPPEPLPLPLPDPEPLPLPDPLPLLPELEEEPLDDDDGL